MFADPLSRRSNTLGALRFGVLGTLAIWREAGCTEIAAAKHRTVLAIWLANLNRTVNVGMLIDELWPGLAPSTARKTVQGYIWRLRRELGPFAGRLVTIGSGYKMILPADRLESWSSRGRSTPRASRSTPARPSRRSAS
ncbi:AfsR/SARP family transcriptional regulator [Nonomuraea diastatica]|uniref:OmpR/PhoB-type domain-containing protein n=1 Tax=Nonomuraea diastatica TaxID=1848329 RepID=A0A4V2YE30_9ACTN|nr:hypothetical protein [Nonomuraea diastatica]TDD17766.1 hypothetical protein E1294_26735 [Nonomuraea diastatica]